MSVITSKISPVALTHKTTVYISTRTTKLSDGTFHVDILQYSDAKGAGGRVIGVRDSGNPNKITWNSNASGKIRSNEGRIKEASKTQMQSMRNDFVKNAQEAERFNSAQGNRNTAIGDGGPLNDYWKSPPDEFNNFGAALKTANSKKRGGNGVNACGRASYPKNIVYPIAIARTQSDKLKITILKYKPKKLGDGFKLTRTRTKHAGKGVGSVTLPAPGAISSSNKTEWGSGTITPIQLAAAGAVKGFLQKKGGFEAAAQSLESSYKQVMEDNENVRNALEIAAVEALTGTQNLLSRTQGMVMNPNMELLFKGPQLRPFGFTYKLSPRDERESMNVLKIIRMFKQSMAPQTTASSLFLKAPNTYKLEFISPRSNREHRFLPKIKECALESFDVNYTPNGSYMTYENSSMVTYEVTFNFKEIEPIYNNDYSDLDGDYDYSIGY